MVIITGLAGAITQILLWVLLVSWLLLLIAWVFGRLCLLLCVAATTTCDAKHWLPLPCEKDECRRLQPICWFDGSSEITLSRRIVTIGGTRCRVLTANELTPGSFGIRMDVGHHAHVCLKNKLPFGTKDTCECDAAMPMMPPTNTNPCWTNLHFHGFWGNAKQDNVYACVKPSQSFLYRYYLNPHHPTGLYIEHVHNFSSSVTQDHITPFIVQVRNPCKADYPRHFWQRTLFIVLAYMQECKPDDDCTLESFDFPKYASGDFTIYSSLLKAGPKLLLVNGQIDPIECFPVGEPVILRVGWMGILDILRFRIVDCDDEPLEYRVLSIDSLAIATQCPDKCTATPNIWLTTEFVAAHMQRFDVMVVFPKAGRYRIIKYATPADDTIPFSVSTRTLMTIDARDGCLDDKKSAGDGSSDCKLTLTTAISLRNSDWVRQVNRRFRNLDNLAAWRTIRFNYPQFPMIEGAEFDLSVLPAQVHMVANRSEVWLVGSASGLHSLHIHLQWFLVMAERESENAPWVVIPKEQQWFQDTLALESGHQFLVWMFPFADHRVVPKNRATGLAMVHCHQSDHTDAMMMLTMLVDPDETQNPAGVGLVMGAQSPQILEITRASSCETCE